MYRLMFYFMLCVTLFFTLTQEAGSNLSKQNPGRDSTPPICLMSCKKNINDTKTKAFCNSQSGGKTTGQMEGRCCLSTTREAAVLGIDLQQCDIDEEQFSAGIKNMRDLLYISLEGNDIKKITGEDFHRNTKIIYLSLQGLSCPGGSDVWNQTTKTTENVTICLGELDTCTTHNVTCPENSHCVHSGVGLSECLCDEGYHGYKCMNQGTFPTMAFVLGIAIPTVILSVLLWVTQRRYVKASHKNK